MHSRNQPFSSAWFISGTWSVVCIAAGEAGSEDDVGLAALDWREQPGGYSLGSYSRSTSWTMTTSPVAVAKPVRSAAPLPWFTSW